jgi:hypothetical protein
LAHASADLGVAEELKWELEDCNRVVFLDSTDIKPGTQWDESLATALTESRVVVVLVSKQTAAAHYERDEIVLAVERMRTSFDHKVIPVLLPGATSADVPYGLMRLEFIETNKPGGMKRVAKTLSDQLPADRTEVIQARRHPYYALGAALRLDRVRQWSMLLEATYVPENSFFLFHGPHDQNVGLFLERIQRFFSRDLSHAYSVYRVRFNIQGQTPRTGVDWLAHLRDTLQCSHALGPRLRQMVQTQPLLIIIGQSPLPLEHLTQQHIAALGEFITGHLVSLLREAQPARGVGVMLALDYEKAVPDLIQQFEAWGKEAEASNMLRFRPLPQASLPSQE